MPLGELLQETLELQARRVPDAKSEVMRRRRELVEREIPAWMQHEPLPYPEWRTGGSSGKGGPAEIPWSRCFDPELSPKAGVGWYVVYLFAADGSAVYLSLNQGTTTWDTSKKDFVFKSTADLRSRVEWARSVVQSSRLATHIDLRANGQLGRWYQAGNVWAVEYRLGEIPSETVLKADFANMTALLVDLYEADLEKVDYAGREVPEVEDNNETTESVHVNVEVPTATATFSASGTLEVTTEVVAAITASRSRLLVPAIADDDTSGPDRLGIARDARALAGLMASRELRPPLAVAIYGEWGSGKTFFMRQIEANIVRLAEGDTTLFEPAVRHIRFGAWHYAQGNLWASLLSHIFATLCPPASASEQMLAAATAKIESIHSALQSADVRVAAIESRAEQIEDEIKKTQERHEGILKSLKAVRKKDIWAGISTDEDLQRRVEGAANDLGVPVAADGARALYEAAQEVAALASRTKFLATTRDTKSKLRILTSPLGAACAIGIGGMILMGVLAVVAPAAIQTLGTYIVSFGTVGAGAAAWIKNQAAAARRLLEPAERLQLQIEQRVADARVELDAEIAELEMRAADAQSDLAEAREHQAKTADELEAARQAKDELSPARLLERYLAERVASGEYDQHLGVVGVVHRDLLNLNEHLQAAVEDSSSTTKRIVLYIDDLDRCSSQTVVEVLEAIHLLLALPLFVVVVGINRRIVDRSLRAYHADLIDSDPCAPTSADYLEKIFQLSYTLPNMSVAGCRAVLREAAGVVELVLDEPDTVGIEEDAEASNVETTNTDAVADVDVPRFEPRMVVDESEQQSESDLAQALSLREADLETLDLVAPLVTATPRRAKRFLSVYLVVRARYASADLDAISLALAIALLVGVPKSLGPALRLLDAADIEGVMLGDWISENVLGDESRQAKAFVESAGEALKIPLSKIVEQVSLVIAYT